MGFEEIVAAKRAARFQAEAPAKAEPDYAAIDAQGEPFRDAISAALEAVSLTEEFAHVFGPGPMQETVNKSRKGEGLWAPEVLDWHANFSNSGNKTFHQLRVDMTAGPEGRGPRCTVLAHESVLGFAFSLPKTSYAGDTPEQVSEFVTEAIAEYVANNTNQFRPARAPGL